MASADMQQITRDAIDSQLAELHELSMDIWNTPELNFEEVHAHQVLTDFLEKAGFQVDRSTPLKTSFVARYGKPGGFCVGLVCEYDALPGIGHACGHNLIAQTGVAAAIGIRAVLEARPDIDGRVIVFGTPAEELGGGKALMIEHGTFAECDVCMMVHPENADVLDPFMLAVKTLDVVYHGKAAHAAAAPWEGVNALDAAVMCYTSVSMLRQQMKPSCRMHGIIVDGGEKPNIIPRRASLQYYVRATTNHDCLELLERVKTCAHAAAKATDCTVDVCDDAVPLYETMNANSVLLRLYKKHAEAMGVVFTEEDPDRSTGSSDIGNVSQVVPAIEPFFSLINCVADCHTTEFAEASRSHENQQPTIRASKVLALSALDLLASSALQDEVRREFVKSVAN